MPYNPQWGVGREPRATGTPVKFQISSSTASSGTSWTNATNVIDTTTITEGNVQIFSMSIALSPRNSNGTTGSATRPTIAIKIDGNLIAEYALPSECSDAAEWTVNEIVPYNYFVTTPNSSIMSTEKNNTAVGGNGYQCNYVVTLYGFLA